MAPKAENSQVRTKKKIKDFLFSHFFQNSDDLYRLIYAITTSDISKIGLKIFLKDFRNLYKYPSALWSLFRLKSLNKSQQKILREVLTEIFTDDKFSEYVKTNPRTVSNILTLIFKNMIKPVQNNPYLYINSIDASFIFFLDEQRKDKILTLIENLLSYTNISQLMKDSNTNYINLFVSSFSAFMTEPPKWAQLQQDFLILLFALAKDPNIKKFVSDNVADFSTILVSLFKGFMQQNNGTDLTTILSDTELEQIFSNIINQFLQTNNISKLEELINTYNNTDTNKLILLVIKLMPATLGSLIGAIPKVMETGIRAAGERLHLYRTPITTGDLKETVLQEICHLFNNNPEEIDTKKTRLFSSILNSYIDNLTVIEKKKEAQMFIQQDGTRLSLNSVHFKGETSQLQFTQLELKNIDFKNSKLTNISFARSTLTHVGFHNSTLDTISFKDATLNNVTFINSNFTNATNFTDAFTESKIDGATLNNIVKNMNKPITLKSVTITGSLKGVDLSNVTLCNCNLSEVTSLEDTNLKNASLKNNIFPRDELHKAINLEQAIFDQTSVNIVPLNNKSSLAISLATRRIKYRNNKDNNKLLITDIQNKHYKEFSKILARIINNYYNNTKSFKPLKDTIYTLAESNQYIKILLNTSSFELDKMIKAIKQNDIKQQGGIHYLTSEKGKVDGIAKILCDYHDKPDLISKMIQANEIADTISVKLFSAEDTQRATDGWIIRELIQYIVNTSPNIDLSALKMMLSEIQRTTSEFDIFMEVFKREACIPTLAGAALGLLVSNTRKQINKDEFIDTSGHIKTDSAQTEKIRKAFHNMMDTLRNKYAQQQDTSSRLIRDALKHQDLR